MFSPPARLSSSNSEPMRPWTLVFFGPDLSLHCRLLPIFILMWRLSRLNRQVAWVLILSALALAAIGLVTMDSFVAPSYFFERQLIWLGLALAVCLGLSFVDFRFLRRSGIVVAVYGILLAVLASLLLFGQVIRGTKGWFSFDFFSFQPADFAKLALILILAKYFSRRHIEIAHFQHILVSGLYAFLPFTLIIFQPDFGSAVIIFTIWLGMIMISGVSKRHLLFVTGIALLAFALLWLDCLPVIRRVGLSLLSIRSPIFRARVITPSNQPSRLVLGN